jgi:hypothetical protein
MPNRQLTTGHGEVPKEMVRCRLSVVRFPLAHPADALSYEKSLDAAWVLWYVKSLAIRRDSPVDSHAGA